MTRLLKLVFAFGLLGAMVASPMAMAASAAEIDVRVKESIEELGYHLKVKHAERGQRDMYASKSSLGLRSKVFGLARG